MPIDSGISDSRYRVGPNTNMPAISTRLRLVLSSLMIFMPLLTPMNTDMAVKQVSVTTITDLTMAVEPMPLMKSRPLLNCSAAKPKEVDRPSTVARMAKVSISRPLERRQHAGRQSMQASRKVRGLLRL